MLSLVKFVDDKVIAAGGESPKSESSSVEAPLCHRTASSVPGVDVQDPSIKELAQQIARDTAFNQMAEQLQETFQGGVRAGAGAGKASPSLMLDCTNPPCNRLCKILTSWQWLTLGNTLTQDFLETFSSPLWKEQMEERMARVKEDPALKHIVEEMEAGGPAAMMRYWNDKEVLTKFCEAMGFPVQGDGAISGKHSVPDDEDV